MIVSFHPIYEADRNIICAGREPGDSDLEAIGRASAVILPQGCGRSLYRMARDNCPNVFPLMDPRFDYPGKVGQARLFATLGVDHPKTLAFGSLAEFQKRFPGRSVAEAICYPMILKLDWGGEGETVFPIDGPGQLSLAIKKAAKFEESGRPGFVIQQLVPCRNRCLRVVVIGRRLLSYWRRLDSEKPQPANLRQGAFLDHFSAPRLQRAGRLAVAGLCRQAGIQLAGFDLLFNQEELARGKIRPLFLEINYYFGRSGLGGSEDFYRLLVAEIDAWLGRRGLKVASEPSPSN